MKLEILQTPLSVIQIADFNELDLTISPLFIANTKDERSVVLPTEKVPALTLNREDGWRALKIVGVLDFSLVGILAKIASLLAEQDISIFAVSTYNTDYILIKEDKLAKTISVLGDAGYTISD
ncbi:ACT domain-containing protein [Enterococcus sp. HY326]|uniref:ACT domain-containing protein n=1 Tax=Enterococcus sp. HY326 TaxID=2971265 RepID=UPI00223E9DED|nr:ACT domain-containing protein [Enterococcus sp. HY326]